MCKNVDRGIPSYILLKETSVSIKYKKFDLKKYFVTKNFPSNSNCVQRADWQNFATVLIHFEFYQQANKSIHWLQIFFLFREKLYSIFTFIEKWEQITFLLQWQQQQILKFGLTPMVTVTFQKLLKVIFINISSFINKGKLSIKTFFS